MNEWDESGNKEEVRIPPPQITVARAVQRLAARSVRRAAFPLGGLFLSGVFEAARNGVSRLSVILVVGALASGLIMLSYGVQAVRRVLGRPPGAWGPIFWVASWVPYLYAMYVLFGLGLRRLGSPGFDLAFSGTVAAMGYSILGALMLRAQWKLSEVHLLSQEMTGFTLGTDLESKGRAE